MTDRNQEIEDKLLQPYEATVEQIFQRIKDETFPERIRNLPKDAKEEVIASLTSVEIIREALRFITTNEKVPEKYEEKNFYLKFPFIHSLLSDLKNSEIEEETIEKIKEWSLEQLPQVVKNLQDQKYIAQAYREAGIKGEVDISFENREQQNAAYLFASDLIRKVIFTHTLQKSLEILGENASEKFGEEPILSEILSFKNDFSGLQYIRSDYLPRLKEAYLDALACESSPKESAKTIEEKIVQGIEKNMSPARYKDWQVASVITKGYEELIEKFPKEVL